MSTEIILPKIGFSMTEGVLAEWLVADGMAVAEGAPLFTIESEKSTTEVEAPASGTLHVKGAPGETYQVGDVIGIIE